MKKIWIATIILLFSSALIVASDVVKSTTEITAYKKLVPSDMPGVTPEEEIPTISSFKIMKGTNSSTEVSDSGKAFESTGIPNNYSSGFIAFYWEMKGTEFREVNVSFKFGPLYAGDTGISGNMMVSELTKVIPYTVTLSDEGYTKVGNKDLTYTGTITSSNTNKASASSSFSASISGYNETLTIYYSDMKEYSGNTPTIYTSSATVSFTGNMSVNSYTYNRYYNQNLNSYVTACSEWTRKGKATVVLNLKTRPSGTEGYYWVDEDDSMHEIISGDYKAYVVVTITTGS